MVFIAFSGEEEGLLGSSYYVKHPVFPMAAVTAMINLDMVGRLRNDRLIVYGVETAKRIPRPARFAQQHGRSSTSRPRATATARATTSRSTWPGKPVLHLFTDLHEDYHRATDDWDKINADGLVRVADFAAAIVRALGRPADAAHLRERARRRSARRRGDGRDPGYGAYLGTIPDMAGGARAACGSAACVPAVRPKPRDSRPTTSSSPIGDIDVPDLQAMTDALRSHKPGDTVEIQVLRDGRARTLTATLGTRSN